MTLTHFSSFIFQPLSFVIHKYSVGGVLEKAGYLFFAKSANIRNPPLYGRSVCEMPCVMSLLFLFPIFISPHHPKRLGPANVMDCIQTLLLLQLYSLLAFSSPPHPWHILSSFRSILFYSHSILFLFTIATTGLVKPIPPSFPRHLLLPPLSAALFDR